MTTLRATQSFLFSPQPTVTGHTNSKPGKKELNYCFGKGEPHPTIPARHTNLREGALKIEKLSSEGPSLGRWIEFSSSVPRKEHSKETGYFQLPVSRVVGQRS